MKSIQRKNESEKRNRQDLFSQSDSATKTTKRTRSRRGDRNSSGSGGISSTTNNNSTKQEAQEIQKSLLRTRGLLQNELQRVHAINQTIEEDGTLLEHTLGDHKSLTTKQASQALKALKDAQRQEQRVLNASIAFFLTVVLYVMWSRVLIKFDFISPIMNLFL
jgi:Sec20